MLLHQQSSAEKNIEVIMKNNIPPPQLSDTLEAFDDIEYFVLEIVYCRSIFTL